MEKLVIVLVSSLLLLSSLASALVQVNIDCGASSPYTDTNGIKWDTDDPYTTAGENQAIKSTDSIAEPIKTLRVFASGTKSCYSVPIKGGSRVRLRVSFYYGNYDGMSSPPSFEFIVDGNDGDTVETSIDTEIHYEMIYVVVGDGTSVCVAQNSDGQLPFVSAIQVWELQHDMYSHMDAKTALMLFDRVSFGASDTIRYPDDAYDRIWVPAEISNSLTVLKSDANSVGVSIKDQPPAAMMKTAVTPVDPTSSIVLPIELTSKSVPVYVNLYFADTVQVGPKDKRSFAVFVGDRQFSDPIVPYYANALEHGFTNISASASANFMLQATSDSTLPPIINAMEVFVVSDPLSNGTDATDVKGLVSLIGQFDALNGWSGDPCLPQKYSWDWVVCNSDVDTPRVIALDLSGYGLYGELPDFSAMDALEKIDLHNNRIGGAIPDFLGKLPHLKELNLADNSLSGPIPSSLSSNTKIKLLTSGNPNLCATGQSCRVISSPANSSGAKKPGASPATKKMNNLGLFFGLMLLAYALDIVY